MDEELPPFPGSDPLETNGQAISRSLSSSRGGAAAPLQLRVRQQAVREQDSKWRQDIAQQQLELRKTAAQAAKDAATLKAAEVKFSLLSKMTDMKQKQEELTHATKAMEEFNGLDYKAGDFPNRVADIYRRNPRALDNPRVASFADKLLGMHETFNKDFRSDVQTDIEKKAAADAASVAKAAGLNPTDVTAKVGPVTTKFEAPKTAPDTSARDDAAHLSRLEGLRMKPSLAKAIGELDEKGIPKTPEGRDAMDQIKYLDEQINAVRGRLSKPAANVTVGNSPATSTIIVPAAAAPTPVPAATITPAPAATPTLTPAAPAATNTAAVDHNAALQWANANPDDPRAAAIRARNGL